MVLRELVREDYEFCSPDKVPHADYFIKMGRYGVSSVSGFEREKRDFLSIGARFTFNLAKNKYAQFTYVEGTPNEDLQPIRDLLEEYGFERIEKIPFVIY